MDIAGISGGNIVGGLRDFKKGRKEQRRIRRVVVVIAARGRNRK